MLLFSSASMRRHPFYVSMTEIEWKPKNKKLEIAVRIFSDDLEKGLAGFCKCKADLGNPAKSEQMEKLLESYLAENLILSENNKNFRFQFLGREKEDESTWSYLEADVPGFSGKLSVKNTILHAVQEKQSNLIRYRKPGSDKTIQLQNPESSHDFL
jgi:hypothetical protein